MAAKRFMSDLKDVIEDQLERNLSPKKLKRYLEVVGPFLLVLTNAEDALRVLMRWSEQLQYMKLQMKWGTYVSALILLLSALVQAVGSVGVITRVQLKANCCLLLGFTVVQPVLYGQLTDVDFVFRSLTQVGGLLLLLRHEDTLGRGAKRGNSQDAFAGMGSESHGGRNGAGSGARLQLLGRVLLMAIFFCQGARHLYVSGVTVLSLVGFLLLFALCTLVVAGFKARWSAVILATALGITNLWMFPFWRDNGRMRDFHKYYFFNTLSIMGGLLLLVSYGPGGLSVDQGSKKGI
mmetsp:Transcript_64/g.174  ORF Transcript_64/g.174 Transcript_64/m.174 type:complete len:293 (+) Transcript_64:57-935(+)